MKKTLAILLLSVHLFNLCGYQLFFSFAENFADKQMITSLDKNKYDESELMQIKLPLNTPYITGSRNYERCDGQIELNGIHYNYVKRMVQNDTMYLYCIPNQQKTELNNTKTEYAKQSSDIPSNKKSEPTAKRGNYLSEYNSNITTYNFSATSYIARKAYAAKNINVATGFITLPAQPPEIFI